MHWRVSAEQTECVPFSWFSPAISPSLQRTNTRRKRLLHCVQTDRMEEAQGLLRVFGLSDNRCREKGTLRIQRLQRLAVSPCGAVSQRLPSVRARDQRATVALRFRPYTSLELSPLRLLMHARRSLPFLGCDGPDGSLPPSPKPPAYDSEDLHQLGVSLLSSLSAPRYLARKLGKNLEHRLHALCPDDAGSGGTGATRLCRGAAEERGGESEKSFSCSAGSFSSLSRFPASDSTAHRRLEKNSFTPLSIRAHRVGAFDAPDVATLLWASLRRRLSQCFVFFFFLSVLFGVYRHLAWTASFSDPDRDLRGELPGTPAGRGSAAAWLVEKEIQKLRRELEEERAALSEYRERMQMQLKKHVASLTQKVEDNLESQRKDLEDLFVKLRGEKNAQGETEEGEQAQQLLADVDNLQEEIRGLEKRNEALETTVDDMRRNLAALAQKQDEGPQKSLLTQAFARKVEDLYTHLVVEEEQTIDWALESLGGRIVVSETAPPLLKPPSWWGDKHTQLTSS
ncbi:Sad1 / UNC family C-terminal protein [Toxoplasma gondii CAST]|uniref:Sad1 / UNC family C-terminal protein n=1 Tax=Toxoplasma gondii CAST TaxID=943122 RepID=A0A425HWC7_TOXGO|nr:Sad1 / UNC family C-terminal protein [Toxoplasma gondii CAST]